jgi:hypothetical protein
LADVVTKLSPQQRAAYLLGLRRARAQARRQRDDLVDEVEGEIGEIEAATRKVRVGLGDPLIADARAAAFRLLSQWKQATGRAKGRLVHRRTTMRQGRGSARQKTGCHVQLGIKFDFFHGLVRLKANSLYSVLTDSHLMTLHRFKSK